ncbi:acyltransferase family protein [Massilia endophytica]|uniref:acyltransferase family protein n=1 Tax=Massilia endophytica TaxID=2899220 RepID=UPI001E2BB854|nr:acyltransferase [Massilia endophytica]UGQ45469.1 acyltransferase [Massilia endophytica]
MDKFIFANQLRGIAAMLVVMTHYFGTYFAEQSLLAARTFSPELHFKPGAWVRMFELPYQGPFGVAIFFLISGFVIPFSLRKASVPGFLVHRALRIFPTYAACLAIGTFAIWCSARYWGQAFSYDLGVLAANALLVHNVLGVPSMDAVNWTLAIEIKFYLLAALFSTLFYRRTPWLLGLVALAAYGTWKFATTPGLAPILTTVTMELNYIVFMVTGIQFYQHVTGLISTRALVVRSLLVVGAFSFTWSIGPQQGQFPWVTVWYYCAYLVFGACYFLRERFRASRVLDFFAAVSYPLYCVHSLMGYCLLKVLMANGLPFGAAVLVALPCAIAAAYAVHVAVEEPTNQAGRYLSRVLSGKRLRTEPSAA